MAVKTPQIGLVEKLGLKYYAFLINIFMFITAFELTHSIEITILVVIALPQIGKLFPADDLKNNLNDAEYNKNWYHMIPAVGSVLGTYFMFFYVWMQYDIIDSSLQSYLTCIIALPFTVGQSIDASHELIHRNQFVLRALGFLGLVPFHFTTYPVEHLYMHHKLVGTPEDAVTSPKNQTIYEYYVRTIFSSYKQTFKYSKSFFAFCIILNWSFVYLMYTIAMKQFQNDAILAGKKTLLFVLIAFQSLFLMECVEYIEHYGLVYRKNQNEKPVLEISSWNTVVNPLYNWITFRFQRHSDHHMNAYKIYSSLELNEKMPQYPFTFPQAVGASWFPLIWYKIADPLVDKVLNNQKLSQNDIKCSLFWMNICNGVIFSAMVANAYTGYVY